MKPLTVTLVLTAVVCCCSYTTGLRSSVATISLFPEDTIPVYRKPSRKEIKISKSQPVIPLDSAAIVAGLELIAKDDCTTCHRVEGKSIGPSYKEIAENYRVTQANIDLLASRTITGMSGVYSRVPMVPHPDLSMEDARKMIHFIFSLK